MAKVIQLIYTEEKVGLGKEGDPVRLKTQLWTLDGRLVAEEDNFLGIQLFESSYLDN